MKKKRLKSIIKVIKASRVQRSTYAILSIFIAASFVNTLNKPVIILAFLSVLFYSVGGLQNAIKDKDYMINKKILPISILIIIITSLIITNFNYKIILLIPIVLLLTFFYNTYSRKILFMDLITMSFTHITIPFLATLWILNKPIIPYVKYPIFMALSFILIINTKNMSGFLEDKKRGYVTLMTKFKSGKFLILLSVILGIILLIVNALILKNYPLNPLLLLIILIPSFFLLKDITQLRGKNATILARMVFVILILGYLVQNKPSIKITALSFLSSFIFIKQGLYTISTEIKQSKFYRQPLKSLFSL
ncbi:hypothetical protein GOV14_05345 [Candidatus Pacearchaeota archaeon]|nr:hypothetical protein [Candidatus Pacearchaeota archaeon]